MLQGPQHGECVGEKELSLGGNTWSPFPAPRQHPGPLSLSVSGAAGVEAGTALQAVTPT